MPRSKAEQATQSQPIVLEETIKEMVKDKGDPTVDMVSEKMVEDVQDYAPIDGLTDKLGDDLKSIESPHPENEADEDSPDVHVSLEVAYLYLRARFDGERVELSTPEGHYIGQVVDGERVSVVKTLPLALTIVARDDLRRAESELALIANTVKVRKGVKTLSHQATVDEGAQDDKSHDLFHEYNKLIEITKRCRKVLDKPSQETMLDVALDARPRLVID